MTKLPEPGHKGQYAVSLSLSDLAKACHLRVDDTAFTLSELGFLRYRRSSEGNPLKREEDEYDGESEVDEADTDGKGDQEDKGEMGEWEGVEIVVSRGMVDEMWKKWRVKDKGVLEEDCVLL